MTWAYNLFEILHIDEMELDYKYIYATHVQNVNMFQIFTNTYIFTFPLT